MIISKNYSMVSNYYSLAFQKQVLRWTLMLPGAGCYYAKSGKACTICAFNQATYKYSRGKLLPSFLFKILYQLAQLETHNKGPTEMFVYNGGSFLNDKEIPVNFQNYLYKEVSKSKTIKRLVIESRAEYITEEKLKNAINLLKNEQKLVVAIGLESYNDWVRNRLINKKLSIKLFLNKVKLIQKLGAEVAVYVFLKPPGLIENEAVLDVLKTISELVSLSISEIYLSSAFVQEATYLVNMYHAGLFKPPKLWSVLKIIEEVEKNNWPVLIGGFDDNPHPIAIPKNCDICSNEIYSAIDLYRKTRKLGKIPNCSCRLVN